MKKFLLTSTSILAVAFASQAFAGGSSTNLQQTGTSQSAVIDQTGAANGRVGVVGGNPFVQQDGSGSGSNVITITQTGSYNAFGVSSQSWQSGTANTATVTQDGYNGDVVLQQTGDGNGTNGGVTWTAGTPFFGNHEISQDSSANSSVIALYQTGNGNIFDIGQGGTQNRTTASQSGAGFNFIGVRQGSNLSSSSIDVNQQATTNDINQATVAVALQNNGTGNQIQIAMVGGRLGASIDQSGSHNYFNSTQYGYDNAIGTTDGGYGDNNYENRVTQNGDWNSITNYQAGSGQTASGSQSGYNNQLTNNQTGSGNNLSFSQSASSFAGNVITNNQSGTNAVAGITQIGNDNHVTNTQSGIGSLLTSYQQGTSNYVYSNQDGFQIADIRQVGASNLSTGIQSGVGLNTANVTQGGNSNVANYNQNGSGNTATIKQ